MNCAGCGKLLRERAAFCDHCGVLVKTSWTNESSDGQPSEAGNETDRMEGSFGTEHRSKKYMTKIGIAAVSVVAIFLLFAFFGSFGRDTDPLNRAIIGHWETDDGDKYYISETEILMIRPNHQYPRYKVKYRFNEQNEEMKWVNVEIIDSLGEVMDDEQRKEMNDNMTFTFFSGYDEMRYRRAMFGETVNSGRLKYVDSRQSD